MKKLFLCVLAVLFVVLSLQGAEARMYDPATGRFLTKDPIGFDGGGM